MKKNCLSRKQRRNIKRKAIGLLCLTMATSSYTLVGAPSQYFMGAKEVNAQTINEEGATLINIRRIGIEDGKITKEITQDGKYILTGSNLINGVRVPTQITVAEGVKAEIILDKLDIENNDGDAGYCGEGGVNATTALIIKGDVDMVVKSESNINSNIVKTYEDASIRVNGHLNMNGGTLNLTQVVVESNGEFVINDGIVNVERSIGGKEDSGGDVIINDGIISAGNIGAGCENIIINGGDITAKDDNDYWAGIGSAMYRSCGNIIINGGNIESSADYADGIGKGYYGSIKSITITGGNISASSANKEAINSSATNSDGESIVKHEITLDGISSVTDINMIKLYTDSTSYYYGSNDMSTDADGKLCIYISANVKRCDIVAGGNLYKYDYSEANASYELINTGTIQNKVKYVDAEDGSVIADYYTDRNGSVKLPDDTAIYHYSFSIDGEPFDGTTIDKDTIVTVDKTKREYTVKYTGDYEGEITAYYGDNADVAGYQLFNEDGSKFDGVVTSDCILEAVAAIEVQGQQYYEINSAERLITFSELVNSGKTALNGMVTEDIEITSTDAENAPVWKTIGTSEHAYNGIFDGNGKKITLTLTNTGEGAFDSMALFGHVNNAHISNVITTGVITTSQKFSGGIIGSSVGNCTIERCGSDIEIIYTPGGDATAGGMIGLLSSGTVTMKDCYYTGTMKSGTEGETITGQGGLVGWKSGTLNASSCYINVVFNGEMTDDEYFQGDLAYGDDISRNGGNFTNCYYVSVNGSSCNGVTEVSKDEVLNNGLVYKLNTANGSAPSSGIWTMGTDGPVFASGTENMIYQVTVNYEDGTFEDKTLALYTKADGTIELPVMDEEEEYTFEGFYDGDTLVTSDTVITSDTELTGRYNETVAHALGRLNTLKESLSLNGSYTEETLNAYNAKLAIAEEMISNTLPELTVEDVKAAAQELKTAYSGLESAHTVTITGDYTGSISGGAGDIVTLPEGYLYYDMDKNIYSDTITIGTWILNLTAIKAIEVDGTRYWEINSADRLIEFANLVNGGLTGLNVILTSDVTITSTDADGATPVWKGIGIGSSNRSERVRYSGIFDGQNHTVTLDIVNTSDNAVEYMSLFGCTNHATIKNVKTTGSITTTKKFSAGIVGYMDYGSIVDSTSDMNIIFVPGGDATAGGIAGGTYNWAKLIGCSYTGTMESGTKDVAITGQGGLVGWNNGSYIYNCFVDAVFNGEMEDNTEFVKGSDYGDDLIRNGKSWNVNNNYYVKQNGSAVGTEVTKEEMGTKAFVYKLNAGNAYTSNWAYSENGPVIATDDNKAVRKVTYKMLNSLMETVDYQSDSEDSIYTSATGSVVLPDLSSMNEEGYVFTGWYDGDTLVSADTAFESDTVLTARFEESVAHLSTRVKDYIQLLENNLDESLYTTSTVNDFKLESEALKAMLEDTATEYTYDEISTAKQELTLAYNNLKAANGTLTLTSNTVGSEPIGAGSYALNDSVTINAKPVANYNFIGWYDGNDNLLSKDAEYTFVYNSEGDRNYQAKYEALPSASISLKLGASCSVNEETKSEDCQVQYSAGTEVTLIASNTDGTFLYWMDDAGMIVTKNPEYTFIVTSDTVLTSVYNKASVETNAIVEFKNDFGQVLSRAEYAVDTESGGIVIPDAPSKKGYTFVKWSMSADEIAAALTSGETVRVMPQYVKMDEYYSVNLQDAQVISSTEAADADGNYRLSTNITVKAKSYEYDKFSHWEDEQGNILGYCEEYYAIVTGNMTIKAVYVDVAETVEQKAAINITGTNAFVENGVNKISYTYTRNIPEELTMISHGLIVTSDETTGLDEDAFIIGGAGIKKVTANTTANMGTFTVNFKNPVVGNKYYARAYVVYIDKNGNQVTLYSDAKSIAFTS